MNPANKEWAKMQLYGLLSEDPMLDIRTLVQKLDTPISTLRKFKTEYETARLNGYIHKTINTDLTTVKAIAEKEAEKLIQVIPEEHRTPEVVLEVEQRAVSAFTDGVAGLQALQTETQDAATGLVKIIVDQSQESGLTPKEVQNLVMSLTSIQNAFFNKPTTNVQVNNQTIIGDALSEFRAKLRS